MTSDGNSILQMGPKVLLFGRKVQPSISIEVITEKKSA
jgi:hypothetical protein